jgi:PIN domain-containing protein
LNQPIKLLVDECLGRPLTQEIQRLLSWDEPAPTIHHLFDYFQSGIKDPVWIPKVKDEGWMILTSDRGKKGRHKLPHICAHYKITHILMSKSVLNLKQYQKANAIVSVWEQIKECDTAPKGSRFRLRLNHAHRPIIERAI